MTAEFYYSYDSLPEKAKELIDPPYGYSRAYYDNYNYLVITWDDKLVSVYNDHMEPEDASFYRDLKWIPGVIMQAYNAGKASK